MVALKHQKTAYAQPLGQGQDLGHREVLLHFLEQEQEELGHLEHLQVNKEEQENTFIRKEACIQDDITSDYSRSPASSRKQEKSTKKQEVSDLTATEQELLLHLDSFLPQEQEVSRRTQEKSTKKQNTSPLATAEQELLHHMNHILPLEMEAVSAITKARRSSDLSDLSRLANLGSPTAQHWLAMALEEDSPARARQLYRQAADQGHPEAAYNLGLWLVGEEGGEVEGRRLLEMAAERGLEEAVIALEHLGWGRKAVKGGDGGKRWYERGREIERTGGDTDWLHAVEMYRRAGQEGHARGAARSLLISAELVSYYYFLGGYDVIVDK